MAKPIRLDDSSLKTDEEIRLVNMISLLTSRGKDATSVQKQLARIQRERNAVAA